MNRALLLAAAALAAAGPARAQFDEDAPSAPQPQQAEQEVDEAQQQAQLRDSLKYERGVADSLALRLDRSKIGPNISTSPDPTRRLGDIRAWIDKNPDAAARLAIGLARDDADGTTAFEDTVTSRLAGPHLRPNPNAKNGIFGRLNKNAKDSKLMKGQSDEMSDEEQREILKTLFEGQGSQSGKIITQQKDPRQQPGGPGAARSLSSSYYDRLSQSNLRGYSPQLQALQSALNARRAPGAPKLIETGKLDYATLSYPAYGMRFDIANIERRLAYERSYALAKLLGLERAYKPEQLLDPEVEKALRQKAGGRELPPRLARRQAALDKAAAALREFQAAAEAAKDPAQITRALLVGLGARQKEAARWISVASLEEELERLEAALASLTPELYQTVQQCPADPADRDSYVRRGELFEGALKKLHGDDQAAIKQLEADDWLDHVPEIERRLADGAALRKDLTRNVEDYRAVAYGLARSSDARPSWRRALDGYWERLLPRTAHSRMLRSQRRERERLRDVFVKIAMGNMDAAHAVLAGEGTAR